MEKIYRFLEPLDDGRFNDAAASETIEPALIMRPTIAEVLTIGGRFHVEHVRNGKVIWEDDFDNLITDLGKAALLNKYLDRATAETAIHMGLKAAGAAANADTMASHAGWTEIASSVVAARLVPAFAAASGTGTVTKATSAAASFPIVTAVNVVIAGCFIVMSGTSAPANTTGTLFSAGDFSASRTVNSGDTLNVSYTAQLT